jgi:hypothetical protein
MLRLLVFSALVFAAAATESALADGLIYQLPDDGAQARYEMAVGISVNGQDMNFKGSVTVSSVGQTTVGDDKCRWIEIKMVSLVDGQDRPLTGKMLIAEKELGKGKSPAEHVMRAWLKEGDAEAREVTDFKSVEFLPMRTFLAGPLQNPGELEKIEIEGKLGKLQCAGVTGTQAFEFGTAVLNINCEQRLHEKAPFGVVAADWKFDVKNNGQELATGTFKLTLTEVNNTALSELPDKK